MDDKKLEISDLFKRNAGEEISTSTIIQKIYLEEFSKIDAILKDKFSDERKKRNVKVELAKLHRKTLYYLKVLQNENLIKETKTGIKNEKSFTLNLDLITNNLDEKIPIVPIEGYLERGITHRLDNASWADRINSILIEANVLENLNELNKLSTVCMKGINDVIGINDFESQINKDTLLFLKKLNMRCEDYGKKSCLIIDLTNVVNSENISNLISEALKSKLDKLTFIFDVQPREFQDNQEFFESIVKLYQKYGKNFYIKNQAIHKAPYIAGRAGPYTFSEREWEEYKRELYGKLKGLVIGQSTVMIDTDHFINENQFNEEELKRLIKKVVESFLIINSMQRRKAENYFNGFIKYNSQPKEILHLSKNYIRFWNYGWKRKTLNQEFLLEAIKSAKELVNQFCVYEETIYKSCGMPIRFRTSFSCAFEEFIKTFFSQKKYPEFYIENLKDFYDPRIKEILRTKENLFEIFDGGDLISFYKRSNNSQEDIMREISFVLGTYRLPFFRYSFLQKSESDQTLMRYIYGNNS
ncbi:hypothetical protein HY498_01955 [Candidatus Woesearchaeota archaeon]|nr:hypothetical protein [Candidatus Woesearchaeota archaeon]